MAVDRASPPRPRCSAGACWEGPRRPWPCFLSPPLEDQMRQAKWLLTKSNLSPRKLTDKRAGAPDPSQQAIHSAT
eukprot:7754537-Pyramimonas_sp.AAC.1